MSAMHAAVIRVDLHLMLEANIWVTPADFSHHTQQGKWLATEKAPLKLNETLSPGSNPCYKKAWHQHTIHCLTQLMTTLESGEDQPHRRAFGTCSSDEWSVNHLHSRGFNYIEGARKTLSTAVILLMQGSQWSSDLKRL